MNKIPKVMNQNELNLNDFPPILRMVLEYKLNSGPERITFKGICNVLNIDYDTFKSAKWEYKAKHNKDMDLYLDEHRMDPIKRGTFDTYQRITFDAVENGKLGQQKLLVELRGDIKNKLEIDHKVTGLFACFSPNPNVMPKDIQEKRKKMKPDGVQIIDVDLDD